MYVHLPIYVPEPWLSESQNGRYGAAVEHVDWSVGQILDHVKRLGLDENTLIIFTSDNGSRARGEGGSNGLLRGHKAETWEGGQRLPCIVRWPGQVAAGQACSEISASIDFLPTLVQLKPVGWCRMIMRLTVGMYGRFGLTRPHRRPMKHFIITCTWAVCGQFVRGPWKLHVSRQRWLRSEEELQDGPELYHLGR